MEGVRNVVPHNNDNRLQTHHARQSLNEVQRTDPSPWVPGAFLERFVVLTQFPHASSWSRCTATVPGGVLYRGASSNESTRSAAF